MPFLSLSGNFRVRWPLQKVAESGSIQDMEDALAKATAENGNYPVDAGKLGRNRSRETFPRALEHVSRRDVECRETAKRRAT